jgi:hypothetical protein
MLEKETFREAFCRIHRCSPQTYTWAVLRRCFFPHALPMAMFLRMLNAPSIERAERAAEQLGRARSTGEVAGIVNEYYQYIEDWGGFWTRLFKVRLSGTRLLCLYSQTPRLSANDERVVSNRGAI